MPIMVRRAKNDFDAMRMATAMEEVGAEVVSIAYVGEALHGQAMVASSQYVIFARVPSYDICDEVDKAIRTRR